MPLNSSKIKTLYDGLKANGSDVGTLQEFTNWFAGNDHYANRKQVFDAYHAAGADVGKDYNEFMQLMYEKPKAKAQAAKPQKSATKTAAPLNPVQPNYGGKPADFFSVTGAERPTAENFRATAKSPFRKLGNYRNAVATKKVAAEPQYINGVETKGFERVPIKAVGVEDSEPLFTKPHELRNTCQKALPEWDEMYPSDQTIEARNKSRKLIKDAANSAAKSYDLMLQSGAWEDYDDIPSTSDWGEMLKSDDPNIINDRNALIASARTQGRDDIADAIESAANDLKSRNKVGSSHAGYDATIAKDDAHLQQNFATLADNNDVTSYRKAAMIHNDVTSKLSDIDEYKKQLDEESKRDPGNGSADGMIVTPYNQTQFSTLASEAEKQRNKERGYIHTARTALEDSKQLIEEAAHHGQTNFFSGAWRGLKNGVIDARTWDMGLNDLCNAKNVYEVLKKADSGKKLTKGEQMLLDAKATEAAANMYYQGYIGRGYKAGQSTADSLPLIAEIVINPASAAGKGASSMMARYMVKRFGVKVAKGAVKMGEAAVQKLGTSSAKELVVTAAKGATKAERRAAMQTLFARGGARLAGDAVGGYVMAATTGQMRTLADATNRLTGSANFKVKTDKDGNKRIAYDGHEEPEETSFLTAYGKALTANAIQYGSEFQGEYIPFVGEIFGKIGSRLMRTTAGKAISKGANKMLTATEKLAMKVPMAQATKDFVVHATHNELVNTLNGIRKRAHISGVGGEYMEEVLGNVENAILVGDNDFSTEEGKGVFNLSDNIDTFLACLTMQGAFSALGAAGYRTPKYRARKAVESADKAAERSMGTHLWRGFTTQYDNATEEADKVKAVTDILTNPNLNDKQRRMAVDYVKARQFQQGVADGSYSEEPTKEEEQIRPYQDIYEAGQEMPTSQRAYAQAEYDYTRQRAQQLCPDIDNYETAEFYAETHPDATDEQKQAARDYLMNKARMDGINDAMQTDYDNATAKNKSFVDNVTNKADGTVTRISLDQQRGDFYVRNGNIVLRADGKLDTEATGARNATIIVTDAQGNEQSVPIRDIVGTPEVQTAEDTLNGLNAKSEAEHKAAQDTLNGKLQFTEGERFAINDNEGNPQSVTIQRDQQTGALAAVIGEDTANPMPLTENAIADLQQRANDYRAQRVAEAYEQRNNEQATEDNTEEATQGSSAQTSNTSPQSADTEAAPLNIGDEIKFSDEQGNEQSGTINDYNEAEGKYEVEFPTPPEGKSTVDWYTPEELRALTATEDSAQTPTAAPQSGETETAPTTPQPQGRAIDRIPTDENGQHIYEKAPVTDTASALMEANNNDAEEAIGTARLMAAKAAERAERAKQHKDEGETVDEIQKNKAAYKTAQENAAYWSNVAQTLEMLQKADEMAAEEENASNETASNETEQTQENEAEPKPIGKGFFGNIYDQFRGQAKAAFDFLMKHKSGDLLGVFHRNDLGDIDLVWGDENMGLSHIMGKHIGKGKDFATAEEAFDMVEKIINEGNIIRNNENRYVIELNGYRVGIRKDFDGKKKNWVVTAIDYNRTKEEKGIDTNPTSASHGVEGSESAAPNNTSADKVTESSQPSQKPSEKIAEAEAQTETNPTETESQANASHQQLRETHAYPEQPLAERTRKACEAVAKALGMELEWVDHMKANGEFVAKGKNGKPTIRIARDAENPLSTVFGHEGTHAVRSFSQEAYQSLVSKAREVVGEEEWNRRLDKAKKLYNEETEEEEETKKEPQTEEEKKKEAKEPQTEEEQKKEAKKQLTDEELVEEVVADIVGEMVTNRDMAEQLAYRLDHPTLSALRDVARKLWEAVKRYVGGIELTDKEQAAKDFADTIERAFADAKEAQELLSVPTQEELAAYGFAISGGNVMSDYARRAKNRTDYQTPNERSEFADNATQYSRRTMPYTIAYYKTLENARQSTVEALEKWSTRMAIQDEVTSLIDKYADKMNGRAKTSLGNSPIRKQEDIYGFTFDVDTSCPRSFANLACVEEAERRLGRPLTLKESVQLNEHLRAYGLQIPCVYCYVENKRQALKDSIHTFMAARNGVYKAKTEEEARKTMYGQRKPTKNDPSTLTKAAQKRFDEWRQRRESGDWYNPTLPELYSEYNNARSYVLAMLDRFHDRDEINEKQSADALAEYVTKALAQYADLHKADKTFVKGEITSICEDWIYDTIHKEEHTHYSKDAAYACDTRNIFRPLSLWNEATKYAKSSSSAKNVSKYMPYTDELRYLKPEQIAALNSIGGLRIHSNNDFRIDYVEDYFQVLAHMSAIGLMGQAYTKNPDFVKIFGGTGLRTNMSIAAYGGEDGKPIIQNEQEGFNWEVARQLREQYPDAGVMMMVTNDAQLEFALNSPWIDMVIPFHASGLPRAVWFDMRKWQNYTATQNEKLFSSSDKVNALKSKGIDHAKETKGMSKDEAAKWLEETFDNTFHVKHVYEIKDGKKVLVNPHFEPGDKIIENETGRYVIPGHQNNRETYLRLCKEYGVKPRFAGIKVHDANGNLIDVTEHPNYIKLIKETSRAEMEQHPVEFNIDKADERMPLITEDNAPVIFGEKYDKTEAGKHMSPMQYAMVQLADFANREGYTNVQDYKKLMESTKNDDIVGDFIENVVMQNRPINYLTDDAKLVASITNKALMEAYGGRMPYEGSTDNDTRYSLRTNSRETVLRDAVIDRININGKKAFLDHEVGQRVLDWANSEGSQVRLQAKLSTLAKAANTIRGWIANNKRGKSFNLELPEATQRMIRKVMGRDFDSHNITANGIAHAQRNHGINGQKINDKSIPLTKTDMELLPYIMTAPDYVRKGSEDITGRTSVRFYKELSNGCVVVAEKEYKNSPNDMETITMWAEMSDKATDAQREAAPDTHVQNAILDIDAAKIRRDAETAIVKDNNLQLHKVYHGSGADFDHFDHSHMGEGEGAQAYGWGTYVTEVEGIGRTYAEQNAKTKEPTVYYKGEELKNIGWTSSNEHTLKEGILDEIAQYVKDYGFTPAEIIERQIDEYEDEPGFEDIVQVYKSLNPDDFYVESLYEDKHLYTVEISDENGSNYLDWNTKPTDAQIESVIKALMEFNRMDVDDIRAQTKAPSTISDEEVLRTEAEIHLDKDRGEALYKSLAWYLGDDEVASKFLADAGFVGIKYPAQYRSGGRSDGAKNYVIFNEADAKITDHIRFFRTANGEAYGFTVGGKIYIDPRIADTETPIHEYTHLWATALRANNTEEWENVVNLMKGEKQLWSEMKKRYPELKTDDELADEVLAHYSGKRGAERLREEQRKIAHGEGSVMEKTQAISALERVRQAIKEFWKQVADFLHIHYTSAEQVADQVMTDLLDGVDPTKFGTDSRVREQFIGEKGAKNMDKVDESTMRMDNKTVAEEMEEAGKDAKAIKTATGWERGADGKWRYEVPDLEMKDPAEWIGKRATKLKDIVSGEYAERLFAAYPGLENVKIKKGRAKGGGAYYDESGTIELNMGDYRDTLSFLAKVPNPNSERSKKYLADHIKDVKVALVHEVQHYIQHQEGFAQGGSPNTILNEEAYNRYNHIADKLDKIINEYNGMSQFERLTDRGLNLRKRYNTLRDEIKGIEKTYRLGYNAYERLAGEVESRNVSGRLDLSDEERRNTLASETEDVPRSRQIVYHDSRQSLRSNEERMVSPTDMSNEEKAERGNALANAKAIDVEANQIVKTDGKSARKAAEDWWEENVGKPLFFDTEIGKVEINENSIGSSLAHRYGQAKLDAITSLEEGFANAVYLGTMPDFVRQEGVQNHYFAYPINYNGKRSYVFCRAMQDANKNSLYVHEVFIADNIEKGNTLQTAAFQPHGGIALYRDILANVLDAANVATSSEIAKSVPTSNEQNGTRYSLRTKPDPKKTQKVYKLMRLGEDGKLYPLFIGSAENVELGKWYDADSPALKDLKSLSSNDYIGTRVVDKGKPTEHVETYNFGVHLVDNETGEAISLKQFKANRKAEGDTSFSRMGRKPSVAAVNWATDHGCRWIGIEETKNARKRYDGEARSYYNYGINGAGSVGTFAMRPGWHAGSLPTMRQIGKGTGHNLRDDSFVWVEGEVPADIDYNEEAQRNADKDIPDHIPTDGFYLKATNANKKASQADKVGWYVAGAFKPNRIISDTEARNVIDEWNTAHPDEEDVLYDFDRESGKPFTDEDAARANEGTYGKRYSLRSKGPSRVFGGNSGYVGYSMSKRAEQAREEGRYPKGDFRKTYKVSPKSFDALVEAGIINDDEWHHTSVYGNKTTFYGWEEDIDSQIYSDNKAEIDSIVKGTKTMTINEINDYVRDNNPYTYELTSKEFNDRMDEVYDWEDREGGKINFDAESEKDRQNKLREMWAESERRKDDIRRQYPEDALIEATNKKRSDWASEQINILRNQSSNLSDKLNEYFKEKREKFSEDSDKRYSLRNSQSIEEVNDKFNEQLDDFERGQVKGLMTLGAPSPILKTCGVDVTNISLSPKVLNRKLRQHGLDVKSLKNLVFALQNPILVYKHGEKNPNIVVVTDASTNGRKLSISLELDSEGNVVELNNVSSIHDKDADTEIERLSKLSEEELTKALKWVEKEKVLDWFNTGHLFSDSHIENNQKLNTLAKVLNDFENPTIPEEKSSTRYSLRQRNRDASQMDMRASRMYEDAMASTWNRIDEAWHDDLLSVRKLQEALEQTTGQRVRDFENVYLHAVHRSSRNKVMMDRLLFDLINPMLDKVRELCTKHNLTQDEIEIYLNCKHGLERNQLLAQRKADEAMTNDKKRFAQLVAKYFAEGTYNTPKPSAFQEEARKVAEQCAANGLNLAATRTEAANAADAYVQSQAADYLAHARERDYSGLTGIFDADGKKGYKVKDLEDLARMEIDRFENEVGQTDTAELWNRIHALNNYSLHQSYRSGLISKRQYDDTRKMYQWYVPLRGFDETTADDVYDYLSHGEPKTQSAIREAKGRTSRAADILATMMNMGNSAVIQGNKNQVKQKLLNLALNYDNPLLSVSKAYYVENPATGSWELAQRKQGETWEDYTQRMEAEVQNGTAVTMSDKLDIPLRTMKWQDDEHAVRVKRGGEEYIIYLNGNPRAAQALNGLLRGEPKEPGRVEKFLQGTMGWLSKSVTSLNPEFVISNFERDLSSAVTVSRGKYGADYARKFMQNALSLTPGLSAMAKHGEGAVGIYRLFDKFKDGTLDRTNPIEAYFEEFMMNGGETGFTRTLSVDDYQAQIERRLAETRTLPMRAADALGTLNGWVDTANRGVENICRFAAFVTSRQAGKSVLTATQDAKEVSTNFNLHGSGDFGNALVRKIALFVNPAIQSVWQYAELTHEHPQRMLRMMAGTAMLGAAMTIASAMLVGGGDGDDDDSDIWHITPFTRRNYLIIPTGLDGTYVKYNLAPELRAIYGVGVIAADALMGRMKHESVVGALGNQLAQLVPVSFFSPQEIFDRNGTPVWKTAARAFTPAYVNPFAEAYAWNEDFMGKPISKDSEAYGNAHKPQYLLAADDTWHPLVEMSRLLNNLSGGTNYKKGWVDINPSKLSHITKSYFGGIYQFLAKAVKAGSWLVNGMPDGEIDAKDIPIVSRFVTSTRSDYNRYLPSNTDYKYYKNEYEETRAAVKAYENGNGNREDYEQLRKTDEYKRYLIMHDSDLLSELKTLSTELKEATDDDGQKRVQKRIYETRKRLVDAVNQAEEQGKLDEYASTDLVADIERETDIDRKLQKQVRLNLRRAKIRKNIGLMTSEQYERLRKAYTEIE